MTNVNNSMNVIVEGNVNDNPSLVNNPTNLINIGQIPVALGQGSMAATVGNGPAGLVQPMAGLGLDAPNMGVARGPPTVMPAERPGKFDGLNFKRWQQKMVFFLTTIGLARFLTEDPPSTPREGEADPQVLRAYVGWNESDYLCRNHVLNCLADSLYNVYSLKVSSKELWDSLDRKYKTEDAGSKKYIVGRFLEYKMVDTKTVVSQVQEFQLIFHEIQAEGMTISKSFQVASVIEKLPPGWKEFKNYLKHKRKEMSLEDLVVRLRIEEDN
jgi:hypothetical protein